MKALTIRHVDPALARAIERERDRRGVSVNQTVLDLLREALGAGEEPRRRSNGLGALAGKWSAADKAEFDEATKVFEQIDPELWR